MIKKTAAALLSIFVMQSAFANDAYCNFSGESKSDPGNYHNYSFKITNQGDDYYIALKTPKNQDFSENIAMKKINIGDKQPRGSAFYSIKQSEFPQLRKDFLQLPDWRNITVIVLNGKKTGLLFNVDNFLYRDGIFWKNIVDEIKQYPLTVNYYLEENYRDEWLTYFNLEK